MSATNLAQYEQYLKSLEQSIQQIDSKHGQITDLFCLSQEKSAQMFHLIHQLRSDVTMLFAWIDKLRSLFLDLAQDQDKGTDAFVSKD